MTRGSTFPVPEAQLRQEFAESVDRIIAERYGVPTTRAWAWRQRLGIDAHSGPPRAGKHRLGTQIMELLTQAGGAGSTETALANALSCTRENIRQGLGRLVRRGLVRQGDRAVIETVHGKRIGQLWVVL